jgi:membrane protein required for colicin V production
METGFVLNPLDIMIAVVIGIGMYRGAMKGVVKRATMLISIAAGVLVGMRLRPVFQSLFIDYLHLTLAPEITAVLSFAAGFIVTFIVSNAILDQLAKGLGKVNVKIDNAMGALFGGIVATLTLSVALILLSYINFPTAENARGSLLYPHVKNFARYTLGMGMEALKEVNRQANQIQQAPGGPPPPPAQTPEKPKVVR